MMTDQDAVDFFATETMRLLGDMPLAKVHPYLAGLLILTPQDSSALLPLRELYAQIGVAEDRRQAIATGQLLLKLDA